MPRRLLLGAFLTLTTLTMTTPTAEAATPNCGTHQLSLTSWSVQSDTVTTSWDFQCGAGVGSDWILLLRLQWRDASGAWHTFDCTNGHPCEVYRPGDVTGPQGSYAAGSEHSGTNTWNTAGQINCKPVRFHANVVFPNIANVNYNSVTYQIGGC